MTNSSFVTDDLSLISARALREVFSKQLKLQILESQEIDPLSAFVGKLLHSAVSINGEKISGTVLLQIPEALALQITEIMLGSAGDAEEIRDVTGELCNMITGRVKAELHSSGFPATLGTPTVSVGQRIALQQRGEAQFSSTDWSVEGHDTGAFNLQVQIRIIT
ncbi:MAG: chemotaxis protein CheX [Verrucomicrobiota bacterium]